MCYSSRADFGWDPRKDAVRKPESQGEPAPPEHPEPRIHADDTRLWAFLARRREPRRREVHAPPPVKDRIGEKV